MNNARGRAPLMIPILVLVVISAAVLTAGCLFHQDERELKVIHAGSLVAPFGEMKKAFESQHPDVDILLEGHGSIQAIRHITELHEEYDVVAVAGDSLIPALMYPDHADWYIRFARNQMVIAYTNQSRYAGEINQSNWYEILARPEVRFGFSNPLFDACGYRTLMVIALAESYYDDSTIFDNLIARNFDPQMRSTEDDRGAVSVVVPEVFRPHSDKVAVRGGSVQLIPMLDYADLDYVFEYKSVAQQNGLRYLELPPKIDLSTPEYGSIYQNVSIFLGFQRFRSVDIERVGKPIFYGITVPKNAPHPTLGAEFVEFVLSEEGKKILQRANQPTTSPVVIGPGTPPVYATTVMNIGEMER